MILTVSDLHKIAGNTQYVQRKTALCEFLSGTALTLHPQLSRPHDLAQLMAQIMVESARLKYVKEIWGPTAAQKRYEGRRDLGNVRKGDGSRYRGRDIIQVTGRENYQAMTKWVRARFGGAPDFEADPAQLENSKWLGMGAVWYWATRVPKKYVDAGNVEMVSVRVNGGRNGLEERFRYFDRTALVFLGRAPDAVEEFQRDAGLDPDGISGPITRAALHKHLRGVAAEGPGPALTAPPMQILGVYPPVRPNVEPVVQKPKRKGWFSWLID